MSCLLAPRGLTIDPSGNRFINRKTKKGEACVLVPRGLNLLAQKGMRGFGAGACRHTIETPHGAGKAFALQKGTLHYNASKIITGNG